MKPNRLDGKPYTKEEINKMFEEALKSEEKKK